MKVRLSLQPLAKEKKQGVWYEVKWTERMMDEPFRSSIVIQYCKRMVGHWTILVVLSYVTCGILYCFELCNLWLFLVV